MTLNNTQLGLLRGLAYPILMVVLTYFSVAENIASLGVSATGALAIAALVSSFEHYLEEVKGKALFGAVNGPLR